MNMDIGGTIKKLRTDRGLTQEEVAEYLGVSFQAVSKWETTTNLPDITLLPKLAVLFGVRIDDLFAVDHEEELQRVEKSLSYRLSEESYLYARRILDAALQDDPDSVGALKLYAKLHLSKTNADLLEAGRMLERAMGQAPLDQEIFALYGQVRGGGVYKARSDDDWFIRVCEPYALKYPQNRALMVHLIEAMIRQRYFEKAETHIRRMHLDPGEESLRTVYRGDLALAKGDAEAAKAVWSTVSQQDSMGQYEVGERFNRLNDYDHAIRCFQNAFQAATPPRPLDAVYSLAFLYTKLGRKAEAIAAWETIIATLAADYNDLDSESVEWARREIRKLQGG